MKSRKKDTASKELLLLVGRLLERNREIHHPQPFSFLLCAAGMGGAGRPDRTVPHSVAPQGVATLYGHESSCHQALQKAESERTLR